MNNLNLRTSSYTLYQAVVTHLHKKPDTYIRLWEVYSDSQGTLFHLLQRMLNDGEITADNLKDGLITDNSLITLVMETVPEARAMPKRPLLHSLWLHTHLA